MSGSAYMSGKNDKFDLGHIVTDFGYFGGCLITERRDQQLVDLTKGR